MGVNRLNPVQKATYLKKSKVGKNEECTVTVKTATDQSVIIGFMQYQHSSVQLVLKNG